jgi:hypothetical protein
MQLPPVSLGSTAASVAATTVLMTLGIDPAALFWAFVGACIGMTFAASASRVRAAVVFCCVVLSCSLFGAWLAAEYTHGQSLSRDAFACILAIVFHPLLNAMVAILPSALKGAIAWATRAFGGTGGR